MLIDLGDTSAVPETPWSPRTTGARPVAVVAAVLAVLVLCGSATAAPPRVRSVLISDELAAAFTLSPTGLFTSGFVGRRALVRRYSLADRAVQWSTELAQSPGDVAVAAGGRVLVVTSPESAQVSFLDSDTGAVLWRRTVGATSVLAVNADSVLMTSVVATGDHVVLQRVGLWTGEPLWSRRLDDGFLDADLVGPIVSVDRRGRAVVLDFVDGSVLATADLGVVPDLGRYVGDGDTARFVRYGERLYLTRRVSGVGSVTAYRIADLRRIWHRAGTPFGWPTGCGEYLCLSTMSGMTALDADTGAALWSTEEWRLGLDSRSLGIPGPSLLVVSDARHTPRQALLDPVTGRVRALLGHGELAGALLLRVDTEQIGRIWIQEFGGVGDLRTVGSLDGVLVERCVAAGELLACADRNERANVWRLGVG